MSGSARKIDSVLFIGFGGPTAPDEVMPFLRKVVEGRGVPEDRLAGVARHYEIVGGRSPYNDLTEAQARACAGWLSDHGLPLPVYVGMRNWRPWLRDTFAAMTRDGRRHAAGVILAAHRSEASWQRYMIDVESALAACGGGPRVSYIDPWFDDPDFLEACAQRIEEASGRRRGAWPAEIPILFTGHSIPSALAARSSYVSDIHASCRGVASILGAADWELAWQSRSGDPTTPWLEPDILEVLRRRAAAGCREVVVQAIGFLSDHVEVLYDLDVEAARVAGDLSLVMRRAPCVGAHPAFAAAIGRRVADLCRRAGP